MVETSGSQRCPRRGEYHATEIVECVAGLGYDDVLPVAMRERRDSRRRVWASEACRAFSASGRLRNPTRVSKSLRLLGSFAGVRPAISFIVRQPALFACDTYHLRLHRRPDRRFDLVIDFSSDLESLYAHYLETESEAPIL